MNAAERDAVVGCVKRFLMLSPARANTTVKVNVAWDEVPPIFQLVVFRSHRTQPPSQPNLPTNKGPTTQNSLINQRQ